MPKIRFKVCVSKWRSNCQLTASQPLLWVLNPGRGIICTDESTKLRRLQKWSSLVEKRYSLVSNLKCSSLVSNLKRSSLGSFKRDTVLWEQLFGWCHCAIRNLLLAKLDALIRFYDVRMHYLCKFFLLLVPNKFFYFCICPSIYFQSKIFSWRFIFAVILTCFHLL